MNGGELVFKPFLSLEHFPQFHMTRIDIGQLGIWIEYVLWDISLRAMFDQFNPNVKEDILNTILWNDKLHFIDQNLF